jgi:hypothetical protein
MRTSHLNFSYARMQIHYVGKTSSLRLDRILELLLRAQII